MKKQHCEEGALSRVNHSGWTSGAVGLEKASRNDGWGGLLCLRKASPAEGLPRGPELRERVVP